jgi:hypothetical protein
MLRVVEWDLLSRVLKSGNSHASWQPRAQRDAWLREFQLWELFVSEDRKALLVCSRDSEDEAFRQEIEFTDFLLDYVRLYVEGGVLLLPTEH